MIHLFCDIRLSKVHRKTGTELVSNGIVGRNLGTKQNVPSQVPPHNAIVDEFGTSVLVNLGRRIVGRGLPRFYRGVIDVVEEVVAIY